MGTIRIGTSGWRYPAWRGSFYPKGLAQRRELEYLSRQVNSIELNGSFYSLQRPERYRHWFDQVPEDFLFAVKGGRFITHMKRLREVRGPLANFFASGVLALGHKLGPVLWQLPANLSFDADRLAGFFELLPRTTAAAARLATDHDERMADRAHTETDADRPVRHALEPRHSSFADPACARLLREHDIALVTADTAQTWPYLDEVTADFSYLRLHGDTELYASGYDEETLRAWATRIRELAAERDVYAYFDNDMKAHAPGDAIRLAAML